MDNQKEKSYNWCYNNCSHHFNDWVSQQELHLIEMKLLKKQICKVRKILDESEIQNKTCEYGTTINITDFHFPKV